MSGKTKSSVAWAEAEIVKHMAIVEDLRAYIRVEQMKTGAADSLAPKPPAPPPSPFVAQLKTAHGHKKRTMLQAIADSPDGLSTQQVIAACTAAGLPDVKVENVSPQLSAYRKAELLRLNSGVWHIMNAGRL